MDLRKLIIALSLILIIPSCSDEKSSDPYPDFSFPKYENAQSVRMSWQTDIYGKDTIYQLQNSVPPGKLFDFYSYNFKTIGFEANTEAVYQDVISVNNGIASSGDWQNPPSWYSMGWINSDHSMVIQVTIEYKDKNGTTVTCFLHPFSDLTLIDKLLKNLEANGNQDELYRIMTTYRKKNGNFDLEKALKNEPPSQLLDNFAKIVREDTERMRNNYIKYMNNK